MIEEAVEMDIDAGKDKEPDYFSAAMMVTSDQEIFWRMSLMEYDKHAAEPPFFHTQE